jgi:hypothetical protein
MIYHCLFKGEPLKGRHDSIGQAKAWLRKHIQKRNRRLSKPDRLHYEDYSVVEYELIQKEIYCL